MADGTVGSWLEVQLRNGAAFDWPGEPRPRLLVTFDWYDPDNHNYTIGTNRPAEVFYQTDFSSPYPVFSQTPEGLSDVWADGTPPAPNTTGAIFADFDNDGYQDFFAPNPDGHVLYRFVPYEDGSVGRFEDVTSIINYTPGLSAPNQTIAASWGDYDGDGFVDLLVSCSDKDYSTNLTEIDLYRNEGGLSFSPAPSGLGIDWGADNIITSIWADFDEDNDVDLLLVPYGEGLATQTFFHENRLHDPVGPGDDFMPSKPNFIATLVDEFNDANNLAVCNDFNNDGLLDVAHYHRHGFGVFTLNGQRDGFDVYAENQAFYTEPNVPHIFDLAAFDADHDGDIDLLTSMQRESLTHTQRWPRLHFQGPGSSATTRFSNYEDFSSDSIDYGHDGKGICAADFTMDGLTELFFTRDVDPDDNEGDFFFDLDNSMAGNWVGVKLEALGNLCNRDCLGATVIVTSTGSSDFKQAQVVDGGSGRASQNRPWLSFGLGDYTGNVDVEVRLPNRGVIPAGTTRTWENLAPRQYHELTMAPFDSADVNISLHHSTFTGNVTLRVEWSTDYPTDWEGDSVVFHVDEPDAIIPGQLVWGFRLLCG